MASPPPVKKSRKANFSDNELSALVDGYEQRKVAIEGKGNSVHGSIAKQRAWEQITRDVFAVSGIRREVADIKKRWADAKSINKKRGAAVKKSQCATGGGVGDEPLNEMEERIVGLLNMESVEGIPGAFNIGVAPIQEVFVGVPFSLPLSGTPARPSSAKPVPSVGTPARPSSARPVPSLDSQEASTSTSGQPEI
ncbi:nuclear apoptosis-inducing factor 1-like [Ixodes scapularis]|uniref:nuclear apoptosis-inducing factor 1-like n=1 Tax=Ixodes scapularis TaxID=6945 RepID=UPI001C3939EF|nr:nuclear apoptosis-inducing factor 1-like [Ixodes scapularis]